ncbi:hypothetical protein CN151_23005 [Sinorhizobium meliloti]|nr:hypothetical protein CN190_07345 [Sinorhizobium meliloti]RVK34147.1 hypothetical protein CN163_22725 [Sinorhizobium meliloti]RVK99225.1 hypothetical protein CN151_23005 [Sinorhizobium meliloti]RVM97065.1 hypothetical protein CN119_05205 [Sinorhizobium meliloti]RVN04384.1 hypothetical protein CN112_25500 [Sinorhizobium meliloti]
MRYATVRLIPLLLVQLQQVISHQFVGRAFGGDQKVQKSLIRYKKWAVVLAMVSDISNQPKRPLP